MAGMEQPAIKFVRSNEAKVHLLLSVFSCYPGILTGVFFVKLLAHSF